MVSAGEWRHTCPGPGARVPGPAGVAAERGCLRGARRGVAPELARDRYVRGGVLAVSYGALAR
jgi:hypothetical protein